MVVAPTDPDIDVPFIINHPIKISNLDQVGPKRAPELGEHTDEILQSLGYSHQQILALKDKGVTWMLDRDTFARQPISQAGDTLRANVVEKT